MATLKELSERTGYSAATISRILNGDPTLSVTEETRRIVLEEAGRLNYLATRSRRGRTPKRVIRIGLAEEKTPVEQLNDPYYLYLSNYIRQECLERKYVYVPLERQGEGFSSYTAEELNGIIAIGVFTPKQVEALGAISPNVLFVDTSPMESLYDSVVPGYELGISMAVDYLLELKHKRIGFIGPTLTVNSRRQLAPEARRQMFVTQMQRHGLLDADLLLECPMEAEAAKQVVSAFLDNEKTAPSAFICANEESAIGALAALKEFGLSVPRDVSIVSFNDTPKSALLDPPLTSISAHVEEMSRTAVRLLMERISISGERPVRELPLKVIVPPSLVIRESTAVACG